LTNTFLNPHDKEKKMDDETVRREAERIAGSRGLTLEELYHTSLNSILVALLDYNKEESMTLIKALAEKRYIPDDHVEQACDLLSVPR